MAEKEEEPESINGSPFAHRSDADEPSNYAQFSTSIYVCCCSADQGGLLALADGPCADTSSILVDLVRVLL